MLTIEFDEEKLATAKDAFLVLHDQLPTIAEMEFFGCLARALDPFTHFWDRERKDDRFSVFIRAHCGVKFNGEKAETWVDRPF